MAKKAAATPPPGYIWDGVGYVKDPNYTAPESTGTFHSNFAPSSNYGDTAPAIKPVQGVTGVANPSGAPDAPATQGGAGTTSTVRDWALPQNTAAPAFDWQGYFARAQAAKPTLNNDLTQWTAWANNQLAPARARALEKYNEIMAARGLGDSSVLAGGLSDIGADYDSQALSAAEQRNRWENEQAMQAWQNEWGLGLNAAQLGETARSTDTDWAKFANTFAEGQYQFDTSTMNDMYKWGQEFNETLRQHGVSEAQWERVFNRQNYESDRDYERAVKEYAMTLGTQIWGTLAAAYIQTAIARGKAPVLSMPNLPSNVASLYPSATPATYTSRLMGDPYTRPSAPTLQNANTGFVAGGSVARQHDPFWAKPNPYQAPTTPTPLANSPTEFLPARTTAIPTQQAENPVATISPWQRPTQPTVTAQPWPRRQAPEWVNSAPQWRQNAQNWLQGQSWFDRLRNFQPSFQPVFPRAGSGPAGDPSISNWYSGWSTPREVESLESKNDRLDRKYSYDSLEKQLAQAQSQFEKKQAVEWYNAKTARMAAENADTSTSDTDKQDKAWADAATIFETSVMSDKDGNSANGIQRAMLPSTVLSMILTRTGLDIMALAKSGDTRAKRMIQELWPKTWAKKLGINEGVVGDTSTASSATSSGTWTPTDPTNAHDIWNASQNWQPESSNPMLMSKRYLEQNRLAR